MKTKKQAKKMVLEAIQKASSVELGILDEYTIEFDYGWMFFYQSTSYIKTGDLNFLVGGNAPIIFDKLEDKMYVTGTAKNEQYYLEKFRDFKEEFKLMV